MWAVQSGACPIPSVDQTLWEASCFPACIWSFFFSAVCVCAAPSRCSSRQRPRTCLLYHTHCLFRLMLILLACFHFVQSTIIIINCRLISFTECGNEREAHDFSNTLDNAWNVLIPISLSFFLFSSFTYYSPLALSFFSPHWSLCPFSHLSHDGLTNVTSRSLTRPSHHVVIAYPRLASASCLAPTTAVQPYT